MSFESNSGLYTPDNKTVREIHLTRETRVQREYPNALRPALSIIAQHIGDLAGSEPAI